MKGFLDPFMHEVGPWIQETECRSSRHHFRGANQGSSPRLPAMRIDWGWKLKEVVIAWYLALRLTSLYRSADAWP